MTNTIFIFAVLFSTLVTTATSFQQSLPRRGLIQDSHIYSSKHGQVLAPWKLGIPGKDCANIISPYITKSRIAPIYYRESKLNTRSDGNDDETSTSQAFATLLKSPIPFALIAFLYWYLLVFGAAAEANGLPVPSFIPLVPSWPPTDQDLAPVIEDSLHFFYISDILNYFSGDPSTSTSTVAVDGVVPTELPALRLAFFNLAEAWVFAFLPLLLADKKRLPLPVVLGTWFGALGLTNAFLAPYLAFRQLFQQNEQDGDLDETDKSNDNKILKVGFGSIASLVVGYAFFETALTTFTSPGEWGTFFNLVQTDRSYLAFAVDLILFSFFQSFLLEEVSNSADSDEKTPFIGLMKWLFR